MKKINNTLKYIGLFGASFILFSCNLNDEKSDAYGNFEAVEVIVSAEGNGPLTQFTISEGDQLKKDQEVGVIDTVMLALQKEEVLANIRSLGSKVMSIHEQIAVYEEQHKKLITDKDRLEKLFKAEAATQQQLDEIYAAIAINEKQLVATKRKIKDNNRATMSQYEPLSKKIDVLNEQIKKSVVHSPINGVVLEKYAEQSEITSYGRPLFKIAQLSQLKVRAYASANQLQNVKVGQEVTVLTDSKEGEMNATKGKIEWISSKSEFTPKTIQTKEERVNLVYAFKVVVDNKDGKFRIGMPAEINF
ncbi:HlyD family efflux transporter periplasmic adaptor subunit [Flammeovirga yaeyamensis]|uniref:HlyD family efflux transporter periplasmic adaptor subunit n=1 Tax=Flammeovirga yaeyamensis TaxID=367791 RepID=A0AAX1MYQ7_9BACT|nr:HlyD family efflux transporter periplasmic adaptor subunit [Flammeovirga yaeyamensis]MBB3696067.1 HlyD family secretion protein [Flammeovirga yaeyamensis]NMF34752.1 HlyD family efflux transporter periplasmic adaptor subunit [Flammeovirga yaeyamensis]QWG00420.1 HlyD family efflux transporter periplasmic adaptor subunit [Flammeovirga yaeyamensis]